MTAATTPTAEPPAMHFADSGSGVAFAKDPAVVRHGGRYLLYYCRHPGADGRWTIGIAESTDLDTWRIVGGLDSEQEYERNSQGAPGAIVLAGRVHLFYQSYGNGPRDAICHPVSDDGLTFVRDETNPMFSPTGDSTNGRAIDADVVVHQDRLLMGFTSRDPRGEIQLLGMTAAPLSSVLGRHDCTQTCTASILAPSWTGSRTASRPPRSASATGGCSRSTPGPTTPCPSRSAARSATTAARAGPGSSTSRGSRSERPAAGTPASPGTPFLFTDDDGSTHLFFQGNDDDGASWCLSRRPVLW